MATLANLLVKLGVDLDDVDAGMSRMVRTSDRAFDRVEDDAERAGAAIDRAGEKAERAFDGVKLDQPRDELGRFVKAAEDAGGDAGDRGGRTFVGRFAGWIRRSLGEVRAVATVAGAGFAAQFLAAAGPGIVSGIGNILAGAGAAAALLPAVALAGVVAFGALKIAVSGVGDALSAGLTGDTEAFNEALEGLSPSAQTFARDVVSLKGRLDQLKNTVQEQFFAPFAGEVRGLAGTYLPALESALGTTAHWFGRAIDSTAGFLQTPAVVSDIGLALFNANVAASNMAVGIPNLVAAFIPLISVGATFLPQLTNGFGSATLRLAAFMQEAQRTGQLAAFIQRGIDSIRQLIDTAQQIGRIFENLGSIGSRIFGQIDTSSGGVLDTIERLTGQFARFLDSARGSAALAEVMGILGGVLDLVTGKGAFLIEVLSGLFGPILPQIGDFVDALVRLADAVLGVGLEALQPILAGIGAVLGTVVLPALTGLANWLASNKPVIQGIGIAILTMLVPAFIAWAINAGLAAAATILAMLPIILLGAAIAALAALVIIHFETIKNAIMTAFNWVRDNWPLLLMILTGPIGIAVGLIVKHWDTIKAAFGAVARWIGERWRQAVDFVKGLATAAKDWLVGRFNDVVGFISGLPGRIASAASGLFDGISDAFRAAVNFIIRGWNSLEFSIPGFDPPGPGSFGGFTLGVPDIPTLATGGIATGPMLAMIGEGDQDEAVLPLDSFYRRVGAGFASVGADFAAVAHAEASRQIAAHATQTRAAVAQLVGYWGENIEPYLDWTTNGIETLIKQNAWGAQNVRWFEDLAGVRAQGFAEGGIVRHRPGGVLARIGEGGQDEAVVPLPRGLATLDGNGGPSVVMNVQGSIVTERELIALIRDEFDRGGFGGVR